MWEGGREGERERGRKGEREGARCIHTQAYAHTHIHTQACGYMHVDTHAHTHRHMRTHTYTHRHVDTCMWTHTHTHTHLFIVLTEQAAGHQLVCLRVVRGQFHCLHTALIATLFSL